MAQPIPLRQSPTMTSKPRKLVFFKKAECQPCDIAYARLQLVLAQHPEYHQYVAVLQKENHSALVAAYELTLFPTVLITDGQGVEISRRVGVNQLPIRWWEEVFEWIKEEEAGE